jgi:hypothetical protein
LSAGLVEPPVANEGCIVGIERRVGSVGAEQAVNTATAAIIVRYLITPPDRS